MTASLAHRAERTSPWSREWSSWCRISARSIPRRRCVGATPTVVTPDAGTCPPPGTVICSDTTDVVPTIWSPSSTANERPGSNSTRESSMSPSVAWPPNGMNAARTKSGHWSAWTTRMSNSTRRTFRRPSRRDLAPALGLPHESPEAVPDVVVADHREQHDREHHRQHDDHGDLDHRPQDPEGGGQEQQQHENDHDASMLRDAGGSVDGGGDPLTAAASPRPASGCRTRGPPWGRRGWCRPGRSPGSRP